MDHPAPDAKTRVLSTCRHWLDNGNTDDPTPILPVLTGGAFKTATLDKDENGRALVRVTMASPVKGERPKERRFRPACAAAVRILELAGARVFLFKRSPTQKQFGLMLEIGEIQTTLIRILFNVSEGSRLVERKDRGKHAYRDIVRENYAERPSADREDVLRVVREQAGDEAADLLREVLQRADGG